MIWIDLEETTLADNDYFLVLVSKEITFLMKKKTTVFLDHNYVQSSFSTNIRHIDNRILKDTLQLKILRTWIKTRSNSFITTWVVYSSKTNKTKIDKGVLKILSCIEIRASASKNIAPK